MPDDAFTPTQRMLLDALADGLPHKRDDLRRMIDPALAERGTLQAHLSNIRRTLRPRGQNILCIWHNRGFCYQWVSLLPRP